MHAGHKSITEHSAHESNASNIVNGTGLDIHSSIDGTALNGNDSDCDSGQQWTQVDRSSNGRQSNRRRTKQINPSDTYQINGHQGFMPRSFRGSFRAPPTDASSVKNRPFHEHNASGSQSNVVKAERPTVLASKLSVSVSLDANGSSAHSPTGSSPSPSVLSPDPHNGGHYRDNRWSYRPQGRQLRGRRASHGVPDANYNPEASNSVTQQNAQTDHGSARGTFSRPLRSPTSSVAAYHGSTEEHWRRPVGGGNWRRPYNGRNSTNYNRYNGSAPHAARQYNNQPRYRPSAPTGVSGPPQSVTSPPPEAHSDAESAVVSHGTPNSAVAKSEPEKRTSWAAAVAASPRSNPPGSVSQISVDPSRTELLSFLLSQWRCFSAMNSS